MPLVIGWTHIRRHGLQQNKLRTCAQQVVTKFPTSCQTICEHITLAIESYHPAIRPLDPRPQDPMCQPQWLQTAWTIDQMQANMCVDTCVCIHVCAHMCVHTYACTHICAHCYNNTVCAHTRAHMCVHTCACTHVRAHVCAHTRQSATNCKLTWTPGPWAQDPSDPNASH